MALFSYPPPAFYFSVSFNGSTTDSSFQEVSGLKVEWEMEELREGGQNRFAHKLPVRTKSSNVVLKRGAVLFGSPLANWLGDCFQADFSSGPIKTQDVIVQLLNAAGNPIVKWWVLRAYPLSWDHSTLSAMESNLLIETIELSCAFVERSQP
jgi:phage tail-like protein